MNTPAAAWWTAFVPIAWIVLTAIVNTIARFATPADVDAWAERKPRLAQFLSIMRRAGFEPIPFIQAIDDFFAGNPPPPGHAVAMGRPAPKPVLLVMDAEGKVSVTPSPRPPPAPRGFIEGRALVFLALFACGGCAAAIAAIPGTVTLGICVVNYVIANPGLTLLEYTSRAILKCGGNALSILDEIIASTDPAVAPLKAEATKLKKEGGARLDAFVVGAHQRAGVLRAEQAPGGSR